MGSRVPRRKVAGLPCEARMITCSRDLKEDVLVVAIPLMGETTIPVNPRPLPKKIKGSISGELESWESELAGTRLGSTVPVRMIWSMTLWLMGPRIFLTSDVMLKTWKLVG